MTESSDPNKRTHFEKHAFSYLPGGDDWSVEVLGPEDAMVNVDTVDHEDGRYSARYTLEALEGEGKRAVFKVWNHIIVISSLHTSEIFAMANFRSPWRTFAMALHRCVCIIMAMANFRSPNPPCDHLKL